MRTIRRIALIVLMSTAALLLSCSDFTLKATKGRPAIQDIQSTVRNGIADNQKIAAQSSSVTVPRNVSDTLLSGGVSGNAAADNRGSATDDEERFNLSVKDETAQAFFLGLVKGTPYNIIVSPNIKGTITLDLKNVTIPEVLEAVRDTYGYDYEKTPYGFRIYPADLQVRIFNVNYLDIARRGQSNTMVSSGEITSTTQDASSTNTSGTTSNSSTTQNTTNSSNIATRSEEDFWKNLRTTLIAIVGNKDGRKVIVNANASTVVVRAYPSELRTAAQYLDAIQNNMDREVIFDAKMFEGKLKNTY